MSTRWFAPGPTVTVPRTPIRELGAVLGSLGDCCGCDFTDFYCGGSVSCDKPQPYGPSEYECGQMGPPINPCAIAIGDTILGTNEEVPGTGQTVGELEAAGYSQADIASIMDSNVAGTGQSVNELLALGYTPSQIENMLATGQVAPGSTVRTGAPGGGSSPGGGSPGGGGGKSAGGGSPTPPKPQVPIVPRPSPTVSTASMFGSNPFGFLTQASIIAGIPNWVIIGGVLVAATSFGGSSGGRKR